jgi:hypothetical protein
MDPWKGPFLSLSGHGRDGYVDDMLGPDRDWDRTTMEAPIKIDHRGQRSCGGISSDQQLGDSFTMHSSSHLVVIDDY